MIFPLKTLGKYLKKKFELVFKIYSAVGQSPGEICDICGERYTRNEYGVLVHYKPGRGMYVHPEHVIKSKQFQNFLNSSWAKNVSIAIKEKGVYVMSHQEEGVIGG